MFTLSDNTLFAGDFPLLTHIAGNFSFANSGSAPGGDAGGDIQTKDTQNCLLRLKLDHPTDSATLPLGRLASARFLALHRYEPFWMKAATGTHPHQIPLETQALFVELPRNQIALFIPLIDGLMRCSLQGDAESLSLAAESGSSHITADAFTALQIAVGNDIHDLTRDAAQFLASHLRIKLRREKPLPAFIDGLGWCTWNAFYQNISHDKIREGLTSLRSAGIRPQFLILDDGWQSAHRNDAQREQYALRLTSLAPNEKFAGDLSPTTHMAKQEFGIHHVLAWHALTGYWAGLDPTAPKLAQYHAEEIPRRFSDSILHYQPECNSKPFGDSAAIIPPAYIANFFQDYHTLLRTQGITGIKVDNQAALEAFAVPHGRTSLYRAYQSALETSAANFFGANLLNCMSCASDLLYTSKLPLTRTSIDFYPDRPHSHGSHLWANAAVATWFGHFIHPDWDMFQSHHPFAEFHAAARALSGGPVYISDPPGTHSAELLRKLTLADGTILRAAQPATLTNDSLFTDPPREDALLKIWTTTGNPSSPYASILGLFNCHHNPSSPLATIASRATATDIPTLPRADGYLLCAQGHALNTIRLISADESLEITLAQTQHQILTFIPFRAGTSAVPIGLLQKFLPSAAILSLDSTPTTIEIRLRPNIAPTDGPFALWCETPPAIAILNGSPITFEFRNHVLTLLVSSSSEAPSLLLRW